MVDRSQILLGLIVVLILAAVLLIIAGRQLVAGVLFLAVSLAIYYREKEA